MIQAAARQQDPAATAQQLKQAILRQALLQAKVEHHEELWWVDDLPQAPKTQVPPKPPSAPPRR